MLEFLLSLRELGCPISIDDCDGTAERRTALGWARERGNAGAAAWLQRNGAVLDYLPPSAAAQSQPSGELWCMVSATAGG